MTPAWLDLAGLTAQAAELRALQPLTSDEIAIGVQDLLERVQRDADAAWSAAWSAARSAARSAAESAAESAARSAAWSAARSAAESAAESAAVERFAPTVATLQASAFELLDRMIEVGKTELLAP
jgi:hypothetical protein